jgi:hypothetical protein
MTTEQLANELRDAYGRAPRGDKVVAIHLFGIRNAANLGGHSAQDVAERAGIGRSFGTEIRKGMRLAEHVSLK